MQTDESYRIRANYILRKYLGIPPKDVDGDVNLYLNTSEKVVLVMMANDGLIVPHDYDADFGEWAFKTILPKADSIVGGDKQEALETIRKFNQRELKEALAYKGHNRDKWYYKALLKEAGRRVDVKEGEDKETALIGKKTALHSAYAAWVAAVAAIAALVLPYLQDNPDRTEFKQLQEQLETYKGQNKQMLDAFNDVQTQLSKQIVEERGKMDDLNVWLKGILSPPATPPPATPAPATPAPATPAPSPAAPVKVP